MKKCEVVGNKKRESFLMRTLTGAQSDQILIVVKWNVKHMKYKGDSIAILRTRTSINDLRNESLADGDENDVIIVRNLPVFQIIYLCV